MSDKEEITHVDGPYAILRLADEVKGLREQTAKLADAAMLATARIPQIILDISALNIRVNDTETEMGIIRKELYVTRLWQAWFPTAMITIALLVRMLFIR